MIILDTNVFSEALKPSPSRAVLRWLSTQEKLAVFTTTITLAEVLYGIEVLPPGKRSGGLSHLVESLFADEFQDRILPFDDDAARVFPEIVVDRERMGRPIAQFDAMIASIARCTRSTVATRNTDDFEDCGIQIVNPWAARLP